MILISGRSCDLRVRAGASGSSAKSFAAARHCPSDGATGSRLLHDDRAIAVKLQRQAYIRYQDT